MATTNKTLRYDAAPHHKLIVKGEAIQGGEVFEAGAKLAKDLLADPQVPVTVVTSKDKPTKQEAPEATGEGHDPKDEE